MYGKEDDDEDNVLAPKEPQVSSQDPEERKAGRALRIKRRQEAIKRAEAPPEEAALEEEPGLIEQATATAAEELQRLSLDGAAKVTNVKVTTDEREVIRRALFTKKQTMSMQKLEAEAKDAQAQYEVITANWEVMLAVKDPLDIQAAMKEQKEKCDFLLAQKTRMVDELKNDLKLMDIAYYDDLDKQDKDIKELSERIEKQVSIMQRAYQKQLTLIQEAIEIEREAMVDHNNKRWDALYRQRDKEELAHMEYKTEQLEEHKLEMEAIMWDHHEKFRVAKIELEVLIQELQKELEKLKATCIINTEKIGYNYQILKKREEENVFVRSQQKRKLNKMSDVANKLRAKIRKAAEDGAIEEIKADTEIVKLMQAMDDLEKKSYQFSHVNNYKFSQIWRMSVARCTELAKQLRLAEVALHAHILSEPPPPPPPPLPKNPLWRYEHEAANESQAVAVVEEEQVDPSDMVAKTAKDKLVRHILQLVADNTGFLVEDRLLKLIEKYELTSRNLCTLDSIFMALEIQAEEDVELLCKVFLNYAFCPVCVGMDNETESIEQSSIIEDAVSRHTVPRSVRGDRSSIRGRSSVVKSITASASRSIHVGFRGQELSPSDIQLMTEADEIIQKCGELNVGTAGTGPITESGTTAGQRRPHARGVTVTSQLSLAKSIKAVNPFLCPMGHYLEIEPMQVLTALGEFVSVFVPPEKRRLYDILDSVKPPDFTTPSRKLKTEEIQQYWMEWKDIFPSDKDRFWDGMLSALNNYLPILQERERLHEEVCGLRRRNAALRRLMRGALPELPTVQPKYMGPYPQMFTSTVPDEAHTAYSRLPPI
ncbi:dynein regulatory complex protein 1 [Leguminivora glycinivorella]|uniref:dynein regulatory complex protein 1 n=1 Tax=Leguminivora glycinivorella TaxID=1035111 RepID=UPI00200C834D|nr:dynein regulatory complex protein 1 [Leguminivora glycinivorella]